MKRVLVFWGIICTFLFSSCLMNKIQYVKDMSPDSLYNIKGSQALIVQSKDRLAITVHSKNIELAAPFNTALGGYKINTEKEIVSGINTNNKFEEGYLVDEDGNIEFPTLGKIHVGGLSIDEISKLITNLIKDNDYLDDPEVKVKLLNFKIMTMGTIRNETYSVDDNKITLLEAIVNAGGLTNNSDAQNVKVIREENGVRKLLVANLEDYNMFNSEAFYLKQNDIVYVPQKYKVVNPGTTSTWQIFGMVIGLFSISLTSYTLLKTK